MKAPHLIDAHTHLHFAAYQDDSDAVIRRALDAGIWMINVGTQSDTSADAIKTAHAYPEGVFATVGLHPIHTSASFHDVQELGGLTPQQKLLSGEEFDFDLYKKLAEDPKVVGIGECGLDYFRMKNDELRIKNIQKEVFIQHIALAHEVKKPLMIHCRAAFDDLIDILVASRMTLTADPGVIHFYSGNLEQTKKLLDLGFSFTFGGVVTFARDYDEIIRSIPVERILTETDAPYVAPAPWRGRRNEPAYMIETAKKLAEIKGIPPDEFFGQSVQNAAKIFGLK